MKNISIWKDTAKTINYPELDKNIETDILIIGGGITGVSTLYHLNNSKLNATLVEQNKVGYSTTGNSTGKLTIMQNDLIDKIRTNLGDDIAVRYLKSQIDAIKLAKDIIKKEKIDCDLEKVKSSIFTNNSSEIKKLTELKSFLEKNNVEVYNSNNEFVKSKYLIEYKNSYIFHPLKFVQNLLEKCDRDIYENTSIKKIIKKGHYYICYTDKNYIKCKKIIVASHYPYFIIPYLFPIKCSLEKSYLSASNYDVNSSISTISYSNPFISIRSYKNNIIYLSNSHSIERKINDKDNFKELKNKLNDIKLVPNYLWSNIDIMTNDGLPYVGKIRENIFIGTGYNTWGLASGILAGKILSNLVLEKEDEYADLFNPKRINTSQIIGGFIDAYKSLSGIIGGYINSNIKPPICPHMGCKLVYNEIEKTWDCPCHGSRFELDGTILSAPANKKIDKK